MMNRSNNPLFCVRAALAVVACAGLALQSAHGEAVADFSGGLGETAVNEFPGSAGQGWIDGWQTHFQNGPEEQFVFAVEKDAAFKEEADVLRVSRLEGEGFVRLSRTLDSGAVDPSANHIIQFQIRLDEIENKPFLFTIAGLQHGGAKSGPSDSAWCLVVDERNSNWSIYHGNGMGGLARLSTGIPLEPGILYLISVQVFPEERLFMVTIESDASFYESPQLPSAAQDPQSETLSFAGWTREEGAGSFLWTLGPVKVRDGEK